MVSGFGCSLRRGGWAAGGWWPERLHLVAGGGENSG
ncbi:hypothetical protein A2U01_0097070, partial [Trifolium medium]|nr:hypothetical protein [Trifolium medium]